MTSVTILKSTISNLGGLEKYTLRLASFFQQKGCDVTLVTTGNNRSLPQLKSIHTHTMEFSSKMSVFKVSQFDRFCSSYINSSKADIVFGLDRTRHQTHIRAGNGVHASYLARRCKMEGLIKSISFTLNPLHRLLLSIEKESFESPNLKTLFTNSLMVKNEILSFYQVDPKKICVIHNGVEWEEMKSCFEQAIDIKENYQAELGLHPKDFHFLFVGSNFRRKGLKELLHAASKLKKRLFHLSIVGKDKEEKHFKDLCQTLGIASKVTFWGERKDVRRFYQMADCLVIPSHYDPFANVTLEALAMGLFVVSSASNGASEIIPSNGGYVIENLFDQDMLLFALENALSKPKTPSSARMIRESVKHLDFSNQLETMVIKTISN
jgi:UDP-glucose:(heptosyl)LPS alpha-1,3-glucosyltransferase